MQDLETIDAATAVTGDAATLSRGVAATLSAQPLDCIDTEYPHTAHAVDGPEDTIAPREDHPIFYGCYDWHSAVHSHWNLLRQRRLRPDHPRGTAIDARFEESLTEDAVAREVAYLEDNPTFERPYGWAWFLRLVAELHLWDDERADRWRTTLAPLESTVRTRIEEAFLPMERPFRVGTHGNTAFALAAIIDYARLTDTTDLETRARETALTYYRDDTDAPLAYEPLGWDFLSPSLTEADLMRRVLSPAAFDDWFDAFAPTIPESVLTPLPISPADAEDIALHYVGLNLSRAWMLAGIAETLPASDRAESLEAAAIAHLEASLSDAVTDEYAGSHWLSSFALYALTRNAGGIAP
ncbi:MAG: DUF2891 domain-containing protein [Halobacteriaceae archaeon]